MTDDARTPELERSVRMRLGTFIVRCGLRIAYGPNDRYDHVTLRRTDPDTEAMR